MNWKVFVCRPASALCQMSSVVSLDSYHCVRSGRLVSCRRCHLASWARISATGLRLHTFEVYNEDLSDI